MEEGGVVLDITKGQGKSVRQRWWRIKREQGWINQQRMAVEWRGRLLPYEWLTPHWGAVAEMMLILLLISTPPGTTYFLLLHQHTLLAPGCSALPLLPEINTGCFLQCFLHVHLSKHWDVLKTTAVHVQPHEYTHRSFNLGVCLTTLCHSQTNGLVDQTFSWLTEVKQWSGAVDFCCANYWITFLFLDLLTLTSSIFVSWTLPAFYTLDIACSFHRFVCLFGLPYLFLTILVHSCLLENYWSAPVRSLPFLVFPVSLLDLWHPPPNAQKGWVPFICPPQRIIRLVFATHRLVKTVIQQTQTVTIAFHLLSQHVCFRPNRTGRNKFTYYWGTWACIWHV